jgi:hypothetical protein
MFLGAMGEDRPNPLTDVRKGLGLLFRAARTAVGKLDTTDLEEVVVTSAREVGRALENVATALEREVLGKNKKEGGGPPADRAGRSGSTDAAAPPESDKSDSGPTSSR